MKWITSFLVVIGLCLSASVVAAQEKFETLTAGAETYKNVTVTGVSATHLQFMHSRGAASVKMKDLSPELQKHFGYDAAKAATAEKGQKAADAQYRSNVTAAAKKPAAKPGGKPGATAKQVDDERDIVVPEIHAKSFRGSKPPKFEAEAWIGNQPDTRGKFVLIDFWATWCGPCRASIPHLNGLQSKFKDKLVIIGLTDEPLSKVKAMKSPQIEYAVATDTQGRMLSAAQVRGIPHAMLIDPSGIVRFEGMPHYLNDQSLAKLIEKYGN
jgi:cytochrome c biogenesis protein CcmG/thiol:disulfide interchange protein DsbE